MAEEAVNQYARGAQTARQLGLVEHCELCTPIHSHTPAPPQPAPPPPARPRPPRRPQDPWKVSNQDRLRATRCDRSRVEKIYGSLRETAEDIKRNIEDLNFAAEQSKKISTACLREDYNRLRKCINDISPSQDHVEDAVLDIAVDTIFGDPAFKTTAKAITKEVFRFAINGKMTDSCKQFIDAWNGNLCEKRILPRGVVKIQTYPKIEVEEVQPCQN